MATEPKNSEILRAAKALVEKPENWIQGNLARAATGDSVSIESPRACKFCALGAIERASWESSKKASQNTSIFASALEVVYVRLKQRGFYSMITAFNDFKTHDEVLELFDESIQLAEKKEGVPV